MNLKLSDPMKIRIIRKGISKAQVGQTVPSSLKPFDFQSGMNKIMGTFQPRTPGSYMNYTPKGLSQPLSFTSFTTPNDEDEITAMFNAENPVEPQPQMTPGQAALNAGIGPTMQMDDVDRQYQSSKKSQRQYDNSLMRYHMQNPDNPDSANYIDWYNKKYPPTAGQRFLNGVSNVSNWTNMGLNAAFTAFNAIQEPLNKMKQKRYQRSMREQNLFATPTMPLGDERGDYTVNEGLFRPDQMQPVNKGMFTNKYYGSRMIGEDGGTLNYNDNPEAMKIRITGRNMEYGGQMGFGLDLNRRRVHVDMPDDPTENLSSSISEDPNPDQPYVLEAEKDETIKRPDGSFATFQGNYHSNGGVKTTAEQTPEGSYIYSRVLKEKRPEVLQAMGVTSKKAYKKGVSFADLTKPFNTNKYVAILNDRNADPYHKNSAQMMKDKFDDKHALAALAQESLKGFPDGIPGISEGILGKAKYGGFLDHYQVKGTVKGQQDVFDNDMRRVILERQRQGNKSVASPRMVSGDNVLPNIQSRQRIGIYGDIKPEEIDEFVARHNWYFKDKPSWDPRKESDVRDFQNQYNTKFRDKYGYDYFNDKRRVSKIDGKFGEYTYNALNLTDPVAPTPPAPTEPGERYMCTPNGVVSVSPDNPMANLPGGFGGAIYNSYEEALANCTGARQEQPVEEKEEVQPGKATKTNVKEPPFGYMYPDIRRMYTARRYAPEMILPFYSDIKATIPQPAFEDWRAKAAARQAMYNTSARTLGSYGPTQGMAANLSFMAGQQADPLIQDIAQTEARNIGIANPFSMAQAEVLNKENEYNTLNKDKRYIGWATARQQYLNALRNRARDIDAADISGWKNRSKLHMINTTNPYYYMDPTSGRNIFKGGLGIDKIANNWMTNQEGSGNTYKDAYDRAIKMLMPEADARKYAYAATTGGSSRSNPFVALQQQAQYYSPLTAASAYGYNAATDED
jgi:hypothetical protein